MILSLFSQVDLDPPVGDVQHFVGRQAHDRRGRPANSRARISALPRVPISPRVRAIDARLMAQRRPA